MRRFYRLMLSGFGFLVIFAAALGQRSVASTDKPTAIDTGNLEFGQRKEPAAEAVSVEGLIRLDVTVTDQSGTAVAGLQRSDFIDPATGAILRLQTQSDLPGFVPTDRADVMVSYGPVDIGDRTYVVPLRSVSIWRGRSVATLLQWNVDFSTWGPYGTQRNVFTFDQYHNFRAKSRILPGFELVPDKEPSAPQ